MPGMTQNSADTPTTPGTGSAPVASLAMVTLDAADVEPLTRFWHAVLGWPIAYQDENYAMLSGPAHALGIGRIDDYQAPAWPNDGTKQFHIDLAATDVEAAVARCVELGATRPAEQPGESWVVLLDPAGHPFCITDAANWG